MAQEIAVSQKPWLDRNAQKSKTYAERFHEKYEIDYETGCWEWQGAILNGYGRFANKGAHRAAYELLRGPIPSGLVLDHLCRNQICVNPSHLEAVTQHENRQRQRDHYAQRNQCKNGHDLVDGNIVIVIRCRQCQQDAWARYEEKKGRKR